MLVQQQDVIYFSRMIGGERQPILLKIGLRFG